VAGDGLLDLRVLALVAILVANDHYAKDAFPGWLTGKLSDFAGLAFFPLVLQAFWELGQTVRGRWRGPQHYVLHLACALTAVAFTLAKTTPFGAALYRTGLAALQWPFRAGARLGAGEPLPPLGRVGFVADPSDLLALLALAIALWIGKRRVDQISKSSRTR
jgi:hypothetical protein